jgi:inner membrane protein
MDSLSQIALGAAVGVAIMGRRTAVWKAALWGAVAGTLPDLDVFIDHGDPVRNMVLHRAETHSLFWLTLFSLPLAALVARLHGAWPIWRRWWLALWLVLVTHPLLDTMTVYGTQLALPFSDHPFSVSSIFIIDPLYTVPLLLGAGWALAARGNAAGLRANAVGLVLSTAYLAWGVAAQQHVERIARAALTQQGIAVEQLLVTPAPLNTVLWRVVAMSGAHYYEGFYSLLDAEPTMRFDRFDRGQSLAGELQGLESVRRIAAFSKGFYKLEQSGPQLLISDLRMGQEPGYSFRFAVAERRSPLQALERPVKQGTRLDLERGLPWLWRRMQGELLPPPR